MKAGWVAGIPAPASVAEDLKSERELQAKRVKANQAASIAGLKMAAAAGSGPLAGGMAAPIGTATNKVARNAVALVMAMTLSVWQGKQSAPWRYDGSHPFICMTQYVEKKDKCNRDRDKALTKVGLPPPACLMCNFFNFPILAPPIEILFKQPPPVGIGPLPPFIVPPCLSQQSPPEKESADKVTQSIIEDFKFNIKELTSKISMMAAQMQQAAQSSAEAAAAAASFIELPPALTPENGGGLDKAKELFDTATIISKKADVDHASKKLAIRDLQLRQAVAKDEDWPVCRAKINEEKAKHKEKKAREELKKAMLKEGAKDPDIKNRDEPDIHEKPGVPFGLKSENVSFSAAREQRHCQPYRSNFQHRISRAI